MEARPVHLGEWGQPSFIGRRQQHARMTASTAVRFTPTAPGERAGLAAFQNDDHYYLLSVTAGEEGRVIEVERRAGGEAEVVASAPLEGRGETVYLRIEADGSRYDFSYATAPDAWQPLLSDADGTILSTHVAGGFVGAMLGLYASSAHP
jgi:alpha-N-arabinofuranosidase